MTVIQAARPRSSSGVTRSGGLLLLEQSSASIHSMDFDGPDRKDEEPSKRPVPVVHTFASEGNSDLQSRPKLVVGGPANAATQGTFCAAGWHRTYCDGCASISRTTLTS